MYRAGDAMKHHASLRWKMTALIVGGGMVSAVFATAGFAGFGMHRFWQRNGAEVATLGTILGNRAGAALALGDRKAASQLLDSLEPDELIRDAALYDAGGGCVAVFHRFQAGGCPPQPSDGARHGGDGLLLGLPVFAQGSRTGTLLLAAGPPSAAQPFLPVPVSALVIA